MTLLCGSRRIASPGKPEPLLELPGRVFAWVEIEAIDTNTGPIYWGDANVRAVVGGEAGLPLRVINDAGDRIYLENVDPNTLYFDVRTATDGVTWTGMLQ